MTGSDDEFEDFLRRRKPIFRAPDDMFEPPAEIDRIVLRQAREAIETERPMRVFRAPRWATPLALAATLVLAFTVIFQVGMPQKREPLAEVTVQSIAQRADYQDVAPPAAVAPMAAADNRASGVAASSEAVVELSTPMTARRETAAAEPASSAGGLVSREESERYAAPPPPAAPIVARSAADSAARERRVDAAADGPPVVVTVPAAKSSESPAWRRDSKTWLAEIERLRNAGDTARANAELEEYKRQHRALAVAPDQ